MIECVYLFFIISKYLPFAISCCSWTDSWWDKSYSCSILSLKISEGKEAYR